MKKIITAEVRSFLAGKKPADAILVGFGKVIIIQGGGEILQKPKHWLVSVEIYQEAERVKFGKIVSVEKTLTENEKACAIIDKMIAPLKKLGDLPFPQFARGDACGILGDSIKNGILNTAICAGPEYYPWSILSFLYFSSSLNIDLAERIWTNQLKVEENRKVLFDEAKSIWNKSFSIYYKNNRIRGRNYERWSGFAEEVEMPLRSYLTMPFVRSGVIEKMPLFFKEGIIERCGTAYPWTEQGLEQYANDLEQHLNNKINCWQKAATEKWQEFTDKIKGGWVLGEHPMSYYIHSLHDGMGTKSEYEISSSSLNTSLRKAIIRPEMLGQKISSDGSFDNDDDNIILLTDEEYAELRN